MNILKTNYVSLLIGAAFLFTLSGEARAVDAPMNIKEMEEGKKPKAEKAPKEKPRKYKKRRHSQRNCMMGCRGADKKHCQRKCRKGFGGKKHGFGRYYGR